MGTVLFISVHEHAVVKRRSRLLRCFYRLWYLFLDPGSEATDIVKIEFVSLISKNELVFAEFQSFLHDDSGRGYIIGDRGRPKLIRYTRQPVFLGHFTPITHENRLKIRFLVRDRSSSWVNLPLMPNGPYIMAVNFELDRNRKFDQALSLFDTVAWSHL